MRVTRLGPGSAPRLLRAPALFDAPPSARAARAYLSDPHNVFFWATEDGIPLGFLRGTALRQIRSERLQMFLYEMGVATPHRRRGVGRALIDALLAYCRSKNFEEIFVLTDPGNGAAVGLYRSTGARPETAADRMFVYRLADRRSRPRRVQGRAKRQSGSSRTRSQGQRVP